MSEHTEPLLPQSALKFKPVSLRFEDVSYYVSSRKSMFSLSKTQKQILKRVSGEVLPHESLAIMGPSGAGKSCLLNILAHRRMRGVVDKQTRVLINNQSLSKSKFAGVAGYVTQDDILLTTQTVEETIQFHADMRTHGSAEQKKQRVMETVELLGLQKVISSRVGSFADRGLSGGERKRLAIATELITAPALLLLDEPTTGLDGYSSMSVMKAIIDLTVQGHTIVFTIHQPRSNIFQMFDKILLLRDGQSIYFGPSADIIPYFEGLGFGCPIHVNPADFLLDTLSENQLEIHSKELSLQELQEEGPNELSVFFKWNGTDADTPRGPKANPFVQFYYLSKRSIIHSLRDPAIFATQLAVNIMIGIIMGSCWYQLEIDKSNLLNRVNAIFFILIHLAISTYVSIPKFINDRQLFNRENDQDVYDTLPYIMSVFVAEIPTLLFSTNIFNLLAFFMIGFQTDGDSLIYFLLCSTLVTFVGSSICMMIAALSHTAEAANVSASGVFAVFILFGGFSITVNRIPKYWLWINKISCINYAFKGLVFNEFSRIPIGGEVLSTFFQTQEYDKYESIYILVAICCAFRVLNYIALRFFHREKK